MKKISLLVVTLVLMAAGCNKANAPTNNVNDQTTTNSTRTNVNTPTTDSNTKNPEQSTIPLEYKTGPGEIVKLAWKDVVFNEFKNLTEWKTEDVGTWHLTSLNPAEIQKFSKGSVFRFLKVFNPVPMSETEMQRAGNRQQELINLVKNTLASDGWKLVASPKEGGFYQDYLYSKLGYPLVLQIGSRDAVTGGMYVSIEFLY